MKTYGNSFNASYVVKKSLQYNNAYWRQTEEYIPLEDILLKGPRHQRYFKILLTAKARIGSSRKPDFWEILRYMRLILSSVLTASGFLRTALNCLLIQSVQAEVSQDPRTSSSYVGSKHGARILNCKM